MNHGRAPRRISHSQRSAGPSGRQWRQRNNEQSKSRTQRGEMEEDEQKAGQREKDSEFRGTCQTMCPAQELQDRERKNCLHRFEMVPGTEKSKKPRGDPSRAVKEYSRPAAGKDATNPTELRPPSVLLKTVCYLIDNIVASPKQNPWTEVYSFVFDRLRSVKQDMIIQRVSGPDCVAILEKAVRFFIYSSYRLCGEPLRLYDPVINDTHLQEFLSWLLDCYSTGTGPYLNQEEFYSLGLLYNLGSTQAAQHVMELPARLRGSPSISLALAINRAFQERNPVRLLRLARRLDFLQLCALHRHLPACRRDLLLTYSHAYSSRNCRFPLDALARLLSLDAALAAQLCLAHGVQVSRDEQVVFSKAAFAEPEQGHAHCNPYHGIVSEKQRNLTVEGVIHGRTTKVV
ncbi:SAC3 domain-containing protein 1 [Menidia menidia]